MCVIPFTSPLSETSAAESTEITWDGSTYINPVASGADPFVLKYDGMYYMYCTNASLSGYVAYYSDDLVNWYSGGYCLRKADVALQPENNVGYWAPEVIEYNGTFYMIYSCNEHLGIATASSPLGPFTDTAGSILSCKAIDGHLFLDDDGKMYLYYVKVENGNRIHGVEFDMETLSPIESTDVELIVAKAGTWEKKGGNVAEGPEMLKHNGKYYLSYSCNGYNTAYYAVGYATSSSPLGTYTRYENNPILTTDTEEGVYSPGHHSFTTSPDGSELFIVYHRHTGPVFIDRHICIDRASFDENGVLSVAGPTSSAQAMPSGAKTDDYTVTLSAEFAPLKTLPTVYVHSAIGNDSNSGSVSAPFATLNAAYNAISTKGGTIVLLSHYDASNETGSNYFSTPKVNGPVMLRGLNPGIRLTYTYFSLNSPHYIDNIYLRSISTVTLIEAQFNSLIIGERVSTSDSSSDVRYPFLIGGHYQNDSTIANATVSPQKYFVETVKTQEKVSCNKDYTLEVYGGTWRSVRAGNWRFRAKAYVGKIDGDITLKMGKNVKVVPYAGVTSAENYAVSVTGNCSLAKGNTAKLIITGGTINTSVFVVGRFGSTPSGATAGYEKFIDGDLEAYVSGGTFNSYVFNGGAGSKQPYILAKQDDVPSDIITGDYLFELGGEAVFTTKPFFSATGVNGTSTVIRTKAHSDSAATYKNFANKHYANYVDTVNGNDENDGTTPEKAFLTFNKAFTNLQAHNSHTVIVNMPMTNSTTLTSSYSRTLRSTFAGVEYNGITLKKNDNITLTAAFPTVTLDKLHIHSEVKNASVSARMKNLTVTESVICTKADGAQYPNLVGGYVVPNTHEDTASEKYYAGTEEAPNVRTLNIFGGTWNLFSGGNYRLGTESTVATLWEDVTVNIGGNARFTANVKHDDISAVTFGVAGGSIQKGKITLNITGGVFETPVYAVTRMGRLASNRRNLIPAGLWGEGVDLCYELDLTVNISGGDFTKAGEIGFTSFAGETPIHGNATLNITGGEFASDTLFCGRGVASGASAVTGLTDLQKVYASGFDTVNGSASGEEKFRILCVGDSITYGTSAYKVTVGGYAYGVENFCYPTLLEGLFIENGVNAEVVNCGFGGSIATLTDSNLMYYNSGAYNRSLHSEADAVVIALGTNNHSYTLDADGLRDYEAGMSQLIEKYHELFPDATIYITTALPRFENMDRASVVVANIIPTQKRLAEKYDYCKLVDLYTAMADYANTNYYSTDKLHPKNEGYEIMAAELYKAINGEKTSGSALLSGKLSTVYISANGTGDGSTPAKATNNISLAMGRLPDSGGTIVIVDSYSLSNHFYTDPRLESLVIKGLTPEVTLSVSGTAFHQTVPSLTIDDITIVNAKSMPYIFVANYNDLTFGAGVTCVKGTYLDSNDAEKTAAYDPLITAGFYVGADDTVADASSDKDCRITVNGGSWNLVRGGNLRISSSSSMTAPMGVYSGNITVRVSQNAVLTSKTYGDTSTYVTAASGMNYLTGSATLILDGIEVYGSVYGISRQGYVDESTPGIGFAEGYSGSVTVIVNESKIATKLTSANAGIFATQEFSPALFTGDYTLALLNSTVNTKTVTGNSAYNDSTLKLLGELGYTPTGFDSTLSIPVGDVDLDGSASVVDLVLVERMRAGWSGYEDYDLTAVADLNKDGLVNIVDATILIRHLAGWSGYQALPLQ